MNKYITILIGLIILLIPIYTWIAYPSSIGASALSFLIGGIIWLLILIGLITLVTGLSSLKD